MIARHLISRLAGAWFPLLHEVGKAPEGRMGCGAQNTAADMLIGMFAKCVQRIAPRAARTLLRSSSRATPHPAFGHLPRCAEKGELGAGRLLIAFAALALSSAAAHAAGDVYIRAGGAFNPIPIAVTPLVGDDASGKISAVVSNDLAHSVFLQPIAATSFPEAVVNPDVLPNIAAWKTVNVQFVLTGRLAKEGGKIVAQYRLWDVAKGEQVDGRQLTAEASNSRRVAHLIADAVFARVTGEKGMFDSHVVFVEESGSKEKRRKRLAIMDMDGANVKTLGGGEDLAVTPRFSPNGRQVAYMSFAGSEPRVTLLDLESGRRTAVGEFSGMTFSPRFSPDGHSIVMSLNEGGASNLYAMGIGGGSPSRLTEGGAIDTSPCYSPDGAQIVFESDRGGTQQLYVMSASGGDARRISFGEGRYSTPVWSPKGDLIAFTRQKGGSFAIGVMKPDGSGERILTEGFHNEGPTFSPNGLFVMFFREPSGQSGPKIYMADIHGHGEFVVPTSSYASDPSWGPLAE